MLKIKVVYEKNSKGDKYEECIITGVQVHDWYCCIFFKKNMPDYLYSDIMDEFWNDFNTQITEVVYDDIQDNGSAIVYMYNPMIKDYEKIHQYS